jgi:hypothetical protein
MPQDRMQHQRFENKYLVTPETALEIREFVRSYLPLDEFSVGKPEFSYPVHSVYLDSDDLKLYWQTINGDKNRFKLRLRYYTAAPAAPVFFEIKNRMNNIICKQRGGVLQDAVEHILAGHFPEPRYLISQNTKSLPALQRFCHLAQSIHARPRIHITYFREAYVSDNDQVRLTLDRQVCAEPNLALCLKTEMRNPAPSFVGRVILELKFTNRFPDWFGDLVRGFDLMQRGAAKYCESVQAVGAEAIGAIGPVVPDEDNREEARGSPHADGLEAVHCRFAGGVA